MIARDRVRIEGLRVACVVGIRPEERDREQTLIVDVELGLDLACAGRSGRIADTCAYDRAADLIAAQLRMRRYGLVEAAAEELAAMLLGVHPMVDSIGLTLRKPAALTGRACAAAVCVERAPADFPRRQEDVKFGHVEILLETREAGLYLLHVDPGKSISRHHHVVMRELEWLVDGELLRDGIPLELVQPVRWQRGQAHGYENRSSRRATLFCFDTPPFIPDDEIEIGDDKD